MKWKFWKAENYSAGCNKIQEELQSLVWSELSSDRAAEIHRHIEECHLCKQEWNAWVEMYELMEKGQTPLPEDEFWELYRKTAARKLDELDRIPQPQKVGSWFPIQRKRRFAYALAVVSVLAVIMILPRFWNGDEPTTQWAGINNENMLEFYVNEFNEVAQDEIIYEPLPVDIVER